jgi:hypothetical protein
MLSCQCLCTACFDKSCELGRVPHWTNAPAAALRYPIRRDECLDWVALASSCTEIGRCIADLQVERHGSGRFISTAPAISCRPRRAASWRRTSRPSCAWGPLGGRQKRSLKSRGTADMHARSDRCAPLGLRPSEAVTRTRPSAERSVPPVSRTKVCTTADGSCLREASPNAVFASTDAGRRR